MNLLHRIAQSRAALSGAALSGLLALLLTPGCKNDGPTHQHASEHPPGHDHHAEGHGHGKTPMVRTTLWSKQLEVFAEHPGAAKGQTLALLAHVTVLDGFRPLTQAKVQLELSGPAPLSVRGKTGERPGIYQFSLTPPKSGTYRGRFVVSGSIKASVGELILKVFDNPEAARASVHEHPPGRFIELLKEQQWGVPFATAFTEKGTLIASIEVAGNVTTPPGGSAEVGAAIAGRVIAPPKGLPKPGDAVKKGQVLATLAPAPSSPEAAARASLAVSEAEARLAKARKAAARAERLIKDQAISQKELEHAQLEVSVAEDALAAAQSTKQLFSGAKHASGRGSWRLVAPIDGTLVDVLATPGAQVAQGTVLFRLVDTSELWIHARVPEQDAPHIRSGWDAGFQIAGLDEYLPIDVTGEDKSATLITIGRTVDRTSRTVDVIYSLEEPDARLRVGGLLRVSIPTGDAFTGVIAPRSAIVEVDGLTVAYVQVDGEHFEERQVRTGPLQGGRIAILQGLKAHERLVVRGAHVVRLASRETSSEPHGHIH